MYRLIEIILPKENQEDLKNIFNTKGIVDYWQEESYKDKLAYKILIQTPYSQTLIDKLSKIKNIRIIVLDVITTLPSPQTSTKKKIKVSREELYAKIINSSEINYIYFTMLILSTIIAIFGFATNNVAVIIGAMVIAPLLGPNIAAAFGITLGDMNLTKKGFITLLSGSFMTYIIAIIFGALLHISPSLSQISSRIHLHYSDIIIAISSGIAGVLAFTTGYNLSLVGVMVAISLLPPLVASGMLFGSGYFLFSFSALLLFFINVVSLILSGVITFRFQGIKAKTWWEEKKAKTYRKYAIFMSIFLLLFFVLAIFINHKIFH